MRAVEYKSFERIHFFVSYDLEKLSRRTWKWPGIWKAEITRHPDLVVMKNNFSRNVMKSRDSTLLVHEKWIVTKSGSISALLTMCAATIAYVIVSFHQKKCSLSSDFIAWLWFYYCVDSLLFMYNNIFFLSSVIFVLFHKKFLNNQKSA